MFAHYLNVKRRHIYYCVLFNDGTLSFCLLFQCYRNRKIQVDWLIEAEVFKMYLTFVLFLILKHVLFSSDNNNIACLFNVYFLTSFVLFCLLRCMFSSFNNSINLTVCLFTLCTKQNKKNTTIKNNKCLETKLLRAKKH